MANRVNYWLGERASLTVADNAAPRTTRLLGGDELLYYMNNKQLEGAARAIYGAFGGPMSIAPARYKPVLNQSQIALKVEYDVEPDGRFIADIEAVPGAIAWDANKRDAALKALAIAWEIMLDEVKHGERDIAGLSNIRVDGLE